MLDAFLSVIDRLIMLKEYQNKRLQGIYQNLLEPIFNDLLLVHRDYIQMFERVYELLYTGGAGFGKYDRVRESAEYLRARRIEFEPVRVKLTKTILELQRNNPIVENQKLELSPEASEFVNAVLFYLRSPYLEESLEDDLISHGTRLLEQLADFDSEPPDLEESLGDDLSSHDRWVLEKLVDFGSQPPEKLTKGDFINQALKGEYSRMVAYIQLRTSLPKKIRHLRINWSLVCEAYVKLKVSVVTKV